MTALKKLVLSFNELSRLDDISHMVRQTQTHDLAFGFFLIYFFTGFGTVYEWYFMPLLIMC